MVVVYFTMTTILILLSRYGIRSEPTIATQPPDMAAVLTCMMLSVLLTGVFILVKREA